MNSITFPAPYNFVPYLSFTERWENLRPIITRLYVDKNRKLSEVMEIMKSQYAFDAG
jgi:hypothetical protein